MCPDIYPSSSEWQDVVGFDFIVESRQLCIALAPGDLITVDVESGTCDCVGLVSSGLQAVSWSSDQELIVLVTCNNTFILMRQSYDAICEKELNPAEFGSGKGTIELVINMPYTNCKH